MRLPKPTISHIPSGKGSHRLLNKSILTAGLSRYVAAFQRFVPPVDWPHIQSPHGRALMLVPLILRCNANPTWFRSSYLEQAQLLLRPLDRSGLLSPVDLIVHAYAVFADAVFAVIVPMHFQVTQLPLRIRIPFLNAALPKICDPYKLSLVIAGITNRLHVILVMPSYTCFHHHVMYI